MARVKDRETMAAAAQRATLSVCREQWSNVSRAFIDVPAIVFVLFCFSE